MQHPYTHSFTHTHAHTRAHTHSHVQTNSGVHLHLNETKDVFLNRQKLLESENSISINKSITCDKTRHLNIAFILFQFQSILELNTNLPILYQGSKEPLIYVHVYFTLFQSGNEDKTDKTVKVITDFFLSKIPGISRDRQVLKWSI